MIRYYKRISKEKINMKVKMTILNKKKKKKVNRKAKTMIIR